MTVDQDIISLVVGVAACITAIAALLNVLMMARAYRPELALSRAVIRSTRVDGEILPRLWIETPDSEPDYVPSLGYNLGIEVRNIGLGTANNVRIKWSFPIEKVVKEVNEIAGTERVLTYNRKSKRLNVKLNEGEIQSVGWWPHRRSSIDYILPASIKTTPTTIMVPAVYQVVVSAMVFFCEKREEGERVSSLPPLKLKIRYKDIGQRAHSALFDVRCEVGIWKRDGEIVRGYLKYRRLRKARGGVSA